MALLVCLIPTTIGGLLSAIGIAGMDRIIAGECHRHLRTSGRGRGRRGCPAFRQDRYHHPRQPPGDVLPCRFRGWRRELADAAQLASLADETPEGRSIVVLAKERHGFPSSSLEGNATFVPFSAQTRMSGVDMPGRRLRKGALDAIARFVAGEAGRFPKRSAASSRT